MDVVKVPYVEKAAARESESESVGDNLVRKG
jgi:hypothetical protein